MGLLGTVLGIIKTFQAMALYGTGNAKSFSAGISEALITTAEGLIVAIPVLVIHGLLKSMVKGKFGEVEGLAIALINGTTERVEDRKGNHKNDSKPLDEADDDIGLRTNPA
jgi:biopolymer transport protein ExbB